MKVAVQFPDTVAAPLSVEIHDAATGQALIVNGTPVTFTRSCPIGPAPGPAMCEVESLHPAPAGHGWVQYTSNQLTTVGGAGGFEALLEFRWGAGTCSIMQGSDAASWVSDDLDDLYGLEVADGYSFGTYAPPEVGQGYCFGDGSGVPCPCAATGAAGHGCPNTNPNGNGAKLSGNGFASFSSDTYGFNITDGASSKPGILIQGGSALNYPNGVATVPNASGIFCVSPTQRGAVFFTDAMGQAAQTEFRGQPFSATAQGPGSTSYYQYWFRDRSNPCQNPPGTSAAFNFSNGYEVIWLP